MEGLSKENKKNETEKPKIKEGVDFVFEDNLGLSRIGTKEQYSEYLDTIFPDSTIHDVFYRGDNIKFSLPTDSHTGVYLTLDRNYAFRYGNKVITAVIETKNPCYISDMPNMYWKRIIDKDDKLHEHDSVVLDDGRVKELIIGPRQIHILGSEQDLENFKKFIQDDKSN
ncbi:hypothetical protein K8Q94_01110 [Candidatus Nomurabacteria bacterium]|nr:hypothetical protein [Candidatus Nomurabacteria bacterium]